ncbi:MULTISPECIES: AraC family transcriptional regulator [Paraclostridium]|jgi:AraC family transcriptional regulator|uniref:AraC family transcriptional regulator n=1 Tax=Paraclostridium bifermentans TaxID=1490 RepID=A0AA44DNA5_PARBF|nr:MULTISPECIES: AraC family transcriptional regulator [Paraclostridium]RDC48800.1 AraC family transcriptional regulator [Acinetobacter sp. RIT592]MBN8049128.1 AraC family transcriptional regulator [Paraclostridium bifermentans]MBS6509289.1 AraC family transcriptional regulator [Paraclostridium bifermentans]MBZ6006922.1 AraC family transcriptional regulator [Paraclostridium bifermentans]MDU0296455.1 AraC family transcriptional regulator [Paraclostridium sp. MRS3W1]
MDMINNFNKAMKYIDQNLENEVDFKKVSQIAGVSEFHFRKIFSYLSGMTLSSYIRKRKLSEASLDLINNKMKIIDVAIKYGYDSADGFTRAFKEWFGVNPSELKNHKDFKIYPSMTFQLTIRGGSNMNYRIEKKNPFKLVGVKKRVPIVFEGQNPEIMKIAQSITQEQRERLQSYRDTEVKTVVNASFNLDDGVYEEKGNLDHLIGSITTLDLDFGEFDVVEVPSHTWAIFSCEGQFPNLMQDTYAKIASEWLPSSGYELVDAPGISFNGDMSNLSNVYSEIWVAIK